MADFKIGLCLLQPLWAPGRSVKPTAFKRVSSEDGHTINTRFSGTGPSTARHAAERARGCGWTFTNPTADELTSVLWWSWPRLRCKVG